MRSPLILNPSLGMEMMQIYRSMQVAFGVSTGIGGVICVAAVVGVGAWVGTTIGSMGGEEIGDVIYEVVLP